MRILRIVAFCVVCISCGGQKADPLFYPARDVGKVSKKLEEASGLVASVANKGGLWSLNDSGNSSKVYLINDHAEIELTCKLDKVENRDWEDISIGRGPEPGVNYLYVAEIGDNNARYPLKYIYRFPEPKKGNSAEQLITNFDTLTLKLPDGARDAETILIDPITNDLFLVSKREDSVRLYRASWPFKRDVIEMELLARLPYTLIVAGSVSANGKEILMKNYNKIFYWKRNSNESVAEAIQKNPTRLSYEPEHQGEAIAWARDSTGFYTLSESSAVDRAKLKFFRRK